MAGALATVWVGPGALLVTSGPLPNREAPSELQQCCPYYPYDGSITFVRIQTASYGGGFRGGRGWAHDLPGRRHQHLRDPPGVYDAGHPRAPRGRQRPSEAFRIGVNYFIYAVTH